MSVSQLLLTRFLHHASFWSAKPIELLEGVKPEESASKFAFTSNLIKSGFVSSKTASGNVSSNSYFNCSP